MSKQTELFDQETVHYGPKRSKGLRANKRVAVCGVIFAVAGSTPEPMPLGSSRRDLVTCERCLELSK